MTAGKGRGYKMGNRQRFKKGDLVLLSIGLVIGVALIGFYLNGAAKEPEGIDGRIAVITRDGTKRAEVTLDKLTEPQYFTFDDGIHITILAENGSIRFVEADCPDKICIKTGTLTTPGDQAICMPSKTIVRILDK